MRSASEENVRVRKKRAQSSPLSTELVVDDFLRQKHPESCQSTVLRMQYSSQN